jgi:predicted SAM-dependent methyltransferase
MVFPSLPIMKKKISIRTKSFLKLLAPVVLLTVVLFLSLQETTSDFPLLPHTQMTNENEALVPTTRTGSATPSCMLGSFHQLCFSFQAEQSKSNTNSNSAASCHQDPERFLKQHFQRSSPSQKQLETRTLMHDKQIRNLSIGANNVDICDDVVVGSTICTEREQLDLFETNSWISLVLATRNKAAGNSNSNAVNGFDAIFSEHVLEHFEPTQVERIAAASFAVLKPGGRFRIAVPDGYKPSPSYQHYIRPGGTPSGAGQNHMVAWTIENFPPLFENAGFEIVRREHFESDGTFVSVEGAYDDEHKYGRVRRSFRHDDRNQKKPYEDWKDVTGNYLDAKDLKNGEPMYTSLWFDAVKPASCDYVLSE